MKRYAVLVGGMALVLFQDTARAYDRYTIGRRLFRRRCGVCLSMGWTWAPKKAGQPAKPPDLMQMARTWPGHKVCTWMHRPTKKLVPPGCYPGRLRFREKLDILYYLWQRSLGPITKPVLKAMTFKFAKVRIRPVTPDRRRTALKRYKAARALRRWMGRVRRRSGRWTGNMTGRGTQPKARPARKVRTNEVETTPRRSRP